MSRDASGLGALAGATTVLALVAALLFLLWERKRRLWNRYDLRKIPGPKQHWLPFVGNLHQLFRPDFHRQVLAWANEFGGIYRLSGLWFHGVVVTDPELLAVVCSRGRDVGLDKASLIYLPINQMCSPRAHANLLTSPADPMWRAVRKAVAASFSVVNIRKKFPVVRQCSEKMVRQLVQLSNGARAQGLPPLVVDVDQAALRVTLDVIGLAGFGHDFGCVEPPVCVTEPAPPGHLLRVLPRCFTEVMLRLVNPFRPLAPGLFHYGAKGDRAFRDFQREMRGLLRGCLLREAPPAPDDASLGAQLWRVYQQHGGGGQEQQQQQQRGARRQEGQLDDETAGGLLSPPPSLLERLAIVARDLRSSMRGAVAVAAGTRSKATVFRSSSLPPSSSLLSWFGRGARARGGEALGEEEPAGGSALAISAERILSEIGILFVEGFETTGHTISWTLLNIATEPGVQERVVEELRAQGLLNALVRHSPSGAEKQEEARQLDVEVLSRLPYLTACVKEAMRMLPVVSVMARTVGAEPVKLGPYLLPPGTPVAIPLYAIHNSDHNWERPLEFRPERFLQVPIETYVVGQVAPLTAGVAARATADAAPAGPPEDGPVGGALPRRHASSSPSSHTSSSSPSPTGPPAPPGGRATPAHTSGPEPQPPSAQPPPQPPPPPQQQQQQQRVLFMPFSEGPRNCVGQTLARLEVVSFLALLLAHFRVELAPEMGGRPGVRERESTHLTLQTRGTHGIRMALHPRWELAG